MIAQSAFNIEEVLHEATQVSHIRNRGLPNVCVRPRPDPNLNPRSPEALNWEKGPELVGVDVRLCHLAEYVILH